MSRYRKLSVVIEAVQFTGKNAADILHFAAGHTVSEWGENLRIRTLEGDMKAEVGDWIIQGVNGEFYPCKPDIFAKTYAPVAPRSPAQPDALELLREARRDWLGGHRANADELEFCARIDAFLAKASHG